MPSKLVELRASSPARSAELIARRLLWRVWACLAIVYVVWGSTYPAVRVMVETVTPLLGSGARFGVAGALMVAFVGVRHGWSTVRLTRAELLGATITGVLLVGANAVVSVAAREVPAGLAALLFASVPLWVMVLGVLARERITRASAVAVLIGFAGAVLLLKPGEQSGDATLLGLLACVGAALMAAIGAVASPRVSLPRDPLVSAGWQMLLAGLVTALAGFAVGEASQTNLAAFSPRSLVAFAYLVLFGSVLAYTAFAWLLQNAPMSQVSTYAYVNPVVAILLGWLILHEVVTPVTVLGAAIILISVALVVRREAPSAPPPDRYDAELVEEVRLVP